MASYIRIGISKCPVACKTGGLTPLVINSGCYVTSLTVSRSVGANIASHISGELTIPL